MRHLNYLLKNWGRLLNCKKNCLKTEIKPDENTGDNFKDK